MRKALIIIAALCCTMTVMAGPNHCGRGGHGGRGWHCGPRYHHRYRGGCYRGSDGVWLAAGITNIVANGLSIVRQVAEPVYTTPVYTTPAPVVTTPVYTTPVYTAPAVEYIPAPQTVPYYVEPVNAVRVEYNNYYPRSAPAYRYQPTYRVIY